MKNNNNYGILAGTVISNPEFNHSCYGEDLFQFYVSTKRTSGTLDIIPVMTSSKMMDIRQDIIGKRTYIEGGIRTRNIHSEDKSRLLVYFFAEYIFISDKAAGEDQNKIILNGTICKGLNFRVTPFGRKITDLILAVNRPNFNKSDYIPVIAWGRNAASLACQKTIGDKIQVMGRLQSRIYTKKYPDGTSEEKTAYEVSAQFIGEIAGEDGHENE